MRRALVWLVVASGIVASGLGACGGGSAAVKRCRSPRAMEVVVEASDRVNVDDAGQALATVVRVYQLRALERLDAAEFEEIWQNAGEALGEDLVKVEELTLFPSERVIRQLEVGEGVSYIVAVALFRKPAGDSWRAVFELPLDPCRDGRAIHRVATHFQLEDYRIETLNDTATRGAGGPEPRPGDE